MLVSHRFVEFLLSQYIFSLIHISYHYPQDHLFLVPCFGSILEFDVELSIAKIPEEAPSISSEEPIPLHGR